MKFRRQWLCAAVAALCFGARADENFRNVVEQDWAAQEKRLNRVAGDAQSIAEALQRAEKLDAALHLAGREVAGFRERAKDISENDIELYRRIRWLTRINALENPLFPRRPLAFVKRNRFICQMLHEYLGYFQDYGNVSGGGVFVLEEPGRSFRTRDLTTGKMPRGNFTTLAVDFSGSKIYFAFAERSYKKPIFFSADRKGFHIFEIGADGSGLRQLTEGVEDDFDPCPLPDGGIAFISSRRGAFCRCNNPWEPIPTYTLHRMRADASQIDTLSFHETNEWHPFVLNDGRIVYTRWDYVDRSAAHFHGLWATNPDGSNPTSIFGNYTMCVNACYQPRAIPGSDKILFVAGAHHADVGGSLVLLDPRQARLNARLGEDNLAAIERLTPEICFAEAEGWPKSYFHSPWPLSEDFYLAAFSFDPLPGMSSGEQRDTRTGLYYFDRWGNLELLYRDDESSAMYPVPLAPRARPPAIPSALDPDLGSEGEFLVHDVRRSLMPFPEGRPIKELRVFQVLPKTESHIANDPRIGYANAESARMLLGTAPVEEDGSAYFRAPARKPIYFQAVDSEGRAVQSMRSITYLQPGERRSCIGCHEGPNVTAPPGIALAARRAPSVLKGGPDGTKPMSFPRLVQPVLNAHCVKCHSPAADRPANPPLLAEAQGEFTVSYDSLRPYVRWHEWGDKSISQIATRPGRVGADESPLTQILSDKTHAALKIPDEDLRRIYLWLDANAPFYGIYEKSARLAQRSGAVVTPPKLQ